MRDYDTSLSGDWIPRTIQDDVDEAGTATEHVSAGVILVGTRRVDEMATAGNDVPVWETTKALRAEWQLGASWNGGYNINLKIINDADVRVDRWVLVIEAEDLAIGASWGSTWTDLGDGRFALTGAGYGEVLEAQGQVGIGFTGKGAPPEDLEVIYEDVSDHPTEPEEPAAEEPVPEQTAPQHPAEPAESGPLTDDTITASWQVGGTWNGGYNMTLKVSNNGRDPIENWVLVLEADGLALKSSWGSTWKDLGDGRIMLTGADYGAVLAAGGSVNIGFTGRGSPPAEINVVRDASEQGEGDAPTNESPFDADDYSDALGLSMNFYYAQYSGDLPDDHPISWRGDSALSDGADVGRDLTGGWYDAGDHVKFGLPMAYTATTLAWGAANYKAGYEAAGAHDDVVAHLNWVNDYLLRCYDDGGTVDLSDDVFYAQVGDAHLDHAFWGAPEEMTMERPAFAVTADNPGTEVTAEAAAAMAASSMVLREAGQAEQADELIAQAKKLFEFSEAYQGVYSDAVPEADDFYHSWTGYQDELAWSASWLYEATGDRDYLAKAETAYDPNGIHWAFTWDDKSMGTAVRLAHLTGDKRYFEDLERHMNHWEYVVERTPGTETNEGLGWLHSWGSNRYAANTAFVALNYASLLDAGGDTGRAEELRAFAADQIDYMLGDNPDDFSFVVGFGDNYALRPHHRGATGSVEIGSSDPNEHILRGALVGGPDKTGAYQDVRDDYIANEVAVDYNAGLSGALAALIQEDVFVI